MMIDVQYMQHGSKIGGPTWSKFINSENKLFLQFFYTLQRVFI